MEVQGKAAGMPAVKLLQPELWGPQRGGSPRFGERCRGVFAQGELPTVKQRFPVAQVPNLRNEAPCEPCAHQVWRWAGAGQPWLHEPGNRTRNPPLTHLPWNALLLARGS